jgi:hypothetical protein
MQLGLRPRLKARPSLVDLLERARSPPASPGTEVATPPLARLARLEEAAVQALGQPLPTSPTADDKDLNLSTSSASSFHSPDNHRSSTPQSPQQLPPTPTISISLAEGEAAQRPRTPEKTVKMAPVRRRPCSSSLPPFNRAGRQQKKNPDACFGKLLLLQPRREAPKVTHDILTTRCRRRQMATPMA